MRFPHEQLGKSSNSDSWQTAVEHDLGAPTADDSSDFTRSRSARGNHQGNRQVSPVPSSESSDFTRSRSRYGRNASDFDLPSVSDITPVRSTNSELWPASQIPTVSDITTPALTLNNDSSSPELLPASSMPSSGTSGDTPVYSESSHSTIAMDSDTLLDVVAPSSNSMLRLDARQSGLEDSGSDVVDANFSSYGTMLGDDIGSVNYDNMLLSLSNVGGRFSHHLWEVGRATPCLSQACRAQGLKVVDPVLTSDEQGLVSNKLQSSQQQISTHRPLLTWVSAGTLIPEPFMGKGFYERMLGLASLCQHISSLGLYGCFSGLPKAATIKDWHPFLKDRRLVGWFFVAGHPTSGPWLTNCHILAGFGKGSAHEYFKYERNKGGFGPHQAEGQLFSWQFCLHVASLIRRLAHKVGKRQQAISVIKRVGDHFSFAYSKWTNRFPDPQYYLTWTTLPETRMTPLLDEGVLIEEDVEAEPSSSSRDPATFTVPRPPTSGDPTGRTPLELPVRKGPSGVELPVTSRTLSELGLNEMAQKDFEALRESILEQRPQVKNVQHITQANGREYFLITFDRVFSEFRFLKDTQSITISCCGAGGRTIYGHDVAAHITHILYMASLGAKEAGNYGAGILKASGFHGNPAQQVSFMCIHQSILR